jgi:opacity protein-like surface antigen
MRLKSAVGICLLMVLMVGAPALAQPAAQSPGPGLLPAGKWQVGVGTTWLSREYFQDTREYTHENGQRDSEVSHDPTIRDDYFSLVTLSYGLLSRLTLFAQAGMAQGGVMSENLTNGLFEAKLKPVFVWGLGARGLLWQDTRGLGLTAGLSYLRYDDRGIDHWHTSDGWTTESAGIAVDGKVDYWRVQADVTAHWRLGRFLPYLGVAYTHSELKDEDTWSTPAWSATYDFSTTNKDKWGLLGGVQVNLWRGLDLGVNFAYFMREEVGLSLSWRF